MVDNIIYIDYINNQAISLKNIVKIGLKFPAIKLHKF